jgi:hypothetical protein
MSKAASKFLIVVFAIMIATILAVVGYVSNRMRRERTAVIETPILRERVALQRGEEPSDVVVWNRTKWSTSAFDAQDIFQTRIEVRNTTGLHIFVWPDEVACAPDSAELKDLVGDGTREFLLSCTMDLRVVQFRGDSYVFRPRQDTLDGTLVQSRFMDLDHEGRLGYIAYLNFPQRFGGPENRETLPLPVVYRWSKDKGFEEVSGQYPDFYSNRPSLNCGKSRKRKRIPCEKSCSIRPLLLSSSVWPIKPAFSP